MRSHTITAVLLGTASATNLYVSSYAGTVTTLSLDWDDGDYSLDITARTKGCGGKPSWLTLDESRGTLFCSNEGFDNNRSVISLYDTTYDGDLTLMDSKPTLLGPVSSVLYGGRSAIAQAHYSGSGVTTYTVTDGELKALNSITFTGPVGPNKSRQTAPHPHDVMVDPTGNFLVATDLGSDMLRVFAINRDKSITARATHAVTPGSGPRHGAFLKNGNATWLFLVSELANTVSSYKVSYTNSSMAFTEVFTSSIFGNSTRTPAGAAGRELVISPDNKHLYTSSTDDKFFTIPNFDSANHTAIVSDTLQAWSIDATTGKLSLVQVAPSGGSGPRQFSLSEDGSLVAVANKDDGSVVIIERDADTGRLGNIVAGVNLGTGVSSVVWDG